MSWKYLLHSTDSTLWQSAAVTRPNGRALMACLKSRVCRWTWDEINIKDEANINIVRSVVVDQFYTWCEFYFCCLFFGVVMNDNKFQKRGNHNIYFL